MPSTKSLSSGTWAITLLAMITSARRPSARSRSRARRRRTRQGRDAGRDRRFGLVRARDRCRAPGCLARRSCEAGSRRCSRPRRRGSSGRGCAARSGPRACSRECASRVVARTTRSRGSCRRTGPVGRHLLEDLHERADRAERHLEREARSVEPQSAGSTSASASGVAPRRQERDQLGRAARAARWSALAIGRTATPARLDNAGRSSSDPGALELLHVAAMRRKRGPSRSSIVRPCRRTPRTAPRRRVGPSTVGRNAGGRSAILSQSTR